MILQYWSQIFSNALLPIFLVIYLNLKFKSEAGTENIFNQMFREDRLKLFSMIVIIYITYNLVIFLLRPIRRPSKTW